MIMMTKTLILFSNLSRLFCSSNYNILLIKTSVTYIQVLKQMIVNSKRAFTDDQNIKIPTIYGFHYLDFTSWKGRNMVHCFYQFWVIHKYKQKPQPKIFSKVLFLTPIQFVFNLLFICFEILLWK